MGKKQELRLRPETIQSLLYQLGLTDVVMGDGEIFARVEQERGFVRVGLIIPRRTEPYRFMERRRR